METGRGEGQQQLEEVQRNIEEWRQTRAKLGAMPGPLWDEAAAVARSLGVQRVALALSLNYSVLKQRAFPERNVAGGRRRARRAKSAAAAFLEMKTPVVPAVAASDGAVVEVVAADGARLTIRVKGATPDLAALVASFR